MDLTKVFETPLQFGEVNSAEKMDQFLKLYDAVAQVSLKRVLVEVIKQDGVKQNYALGFFFSKACRNRGVAEDGITDDYIKRLMALECLIQDSEELLFKEFTVTRTYPNTTSIRVVPEHKSEKEIYTTMIHDLENFLKRKTDNIEMMKHVMLRRGSLSREDQETLRSLHDKLMTCEGF